MDMTGIGDVPGADQPLDGTDVALLDRIAAVDTLLDPVPEGLVERSLFRMTLASLHAEVMELQVLEVPAGSVRGDAPPVETRTITFTHDRLTVMISLSGGSAPGTVRVDGWIAPAEACDVELRRPDGVRTSAADADGRFVFTDVPRGPASLLVRQGEPPVSTPVIEL